MGASLAWYWQRVLWSAEKPRKGRKEMLIETATLKAHYCHLPKDARIIVNDLENLVSVIPEAVVRCKDCKYCTINTTVMTTLTIPK